MNSDCVFCKIAGGEIDAKLAYEDDVVVAFDDLSPVAPLHVLVIPREHVGPLADAAETSGALLGRLVQAAARVAADRGFAETGYRLVVNQGNDAGQVVDHLHLHVIGGRRMGALA